MKEGEIRANIISNLYRIMGTGRNIKLTIAELAKRTAIPRESIRHAKYNGIASVERLVQIADALGVTLNDLVYYRGQNE